MGKAADSIADALETLVAEAVDIAIDEIDFEDKIDISDFVRAEDVMDHVDVEALKDEMVLPDYDDFTQMQLRVKALELRVGQFDQCIAALRTLLTPEEG